jgi:hypothetical protein
MKPGTTPDREDHPQAEIIPPDRGGPRSGRTQSRIWISVDTNTGRQVRIGWPGLFATIATILVFSLILAALLVIFLGALLIWVPVVTMLAAAVLIAGILHRNLR